MISTLHHLLSPLATFCFTLWAAWLSLATEADAEVPRLLADQHFTEGRKLSPARSLYVGHLAALFLAGAAAGTAESWWVWGPAGALTRFALAALLVWVVGSILPKVLAVVAPELPVQVRPGALRSLRLFAPLIASVAWMESRIRPAQTLASHEGGPTRRDMLVGLFSLADMTVAEVMTPRIDVVAVDTAASRDEVIGVLRGSEHARILVYDGNPDAVVGVLYAKDMLGTPPGPEFDEWHCLIRPAAFVPEGKTLDRQLRDFQRGPSHLAVVVDEFGGTAGLVTLEDVLEQVVGEIRDEHDTDETAPIVRTGEGRLTVEGGVPLAELESQLGHSFRRDDVTTVGGLVLDLFGRVPRSGERTQTDGIELVVEQVVRRRVRRVQVSRLARAEAEEETE
jgi:magnesium and cobalt transporter